MNWFKLCPRYGNWGGPGWSAGGYPSTPEETDWTVEAVDSMDECFKNHDNKYQVAITMYNSGNLNEWQMHNFWSIADVELIEKLNKISMNPSDWKRPPKVWWYAWIYRKAAIGAFGLKVKFVGKGSPALAAPRSWVRPQTGRIHDVS